MPNRVQENREKILKLLSSVKRPGMQKLIEYIEVYTDFFIAPASTKFHSNYQGGLAEHSLLVYERFKEKNELYNLGFSEESLIICGILHDLCKVNFYKVGTRNKKDETTGKWMKVPCYLIDDELPLGHGDKSVIMIMGFMRLTVDEMLTIRWHMGGYVAPQDYNTCSAAWNKCKGAVCLHTADLEASYLYEEHIEY